MKKFCAPPNHTPQKMPRRTALALLGGGALAALWPAHTAWASSAVDTLNLFFKDISSLKANFKQVVTSTQNDRVKNSSGTFMLLRPNCFRFDYVKPYEQQIISDGKNLWLYDMDLQQVTQRAYDSAMDSTPAALLAGGAQATMAQENFTLSNAPDADGQQWVQASPKQEEGQIRSARIGFRNQMLETLQIIDNFGQTSTLTFSDVQANLTLGHELFEFTVPDGVDLING